MENCHFDAKIEQKLLQVLQMIKDCNLQTVQARTMCVHVRMYSAECTKSADF